MSIDYNVFQALEKNIVESGLCKGCGACVLACDFDVIEIEGNRPVYIGKNECVNCGMCLYICPSISKVTTNVGQHFEPIFLKARSLDEDLSYSGQNAGVTNTLAFAGLKKGIQAIRTLKIGKDVTEILPFNAYNKSDLLLSSGAKFFLTPISVEVDDLRRQDITSNIFIGLPCVISSIRSLQKYNFHRLNEIIKYSFGLFCRGIIDPNKFRSYIKSYNISIEEIKSINYSKQEDDIHMVIHLKDETHVELEESEWHQLIWEACDYCHDFFAETSDISIGWEGSPEGWQSVIVFTDKGHELVNYAVEQKLLEIEALGEDEISTLKKIHELKDKSAKFL